MPLKLTMAGDLEIKDGRRCRPTGPAVLLTGTEADVAGVVRQHFGREVRVVALDLPVPEPLPVAPTAPALRARSTRGPLALDEIAARDLDDLAGMIHDAAAEVYAVAQLLPDVPGDTGTPRFRLMQKFVSLTGIATGIQGGILGGKDAVDAMNRGFDVASRRWRG